ncbi:MAG: hypothetical protein OEY77_02130 [Nitrospira sp.]|nr:hypothetical protein [Nitrospira sp.]
MKPSAEIIFLSARPRLIKDSLAPQFHCATGDHLCLLHRTTRSGEGEREQFCWRYWSTPRMFSGNFLFPREKLLRAQLLPTLIREREGFDEWPQRKVVQEMPMSMMKSMRDMPMFPLMPIGPLVVMITVVSLSILNYRSLKKVEAKLDEINSSRS